MADEKPSGGGGMHDVVTLRMVAGSLGAVATMVAVGVCALAFVGREVPPALTALGSAALGSLASMLAAAMRPAS